jgi:hypothetical protein
MHGSAPGTTGIVLKIKINQSPSYRQREKNESFLYGIMVSE